MKRNLEVNRGMLVVLAILSVSIFLGGCSKKNDKLSQPAGNNANSDVESTQSVPEAKMIESKPGHSFQVNLGDFKRDISGVEVYQAENGKEEKVQANIPDTVENIAELLSKAEKVDEKDKINESLSRDYFRMFIQDTDLSKHEIRVFSGTGLRKSIISFGGNQFRADKGLDRILQSLMIYKDAQGEIDGESKKILLEKGWSPLFESFRQTIILPELYSMKSDSKSDQVYWNLANLLVMDSGIGLEQYKGKEIEARIIPLSESPPIKLKSKKPCRAVMLYSGGSYVGGFIETVDSELLGCSLNKKIKSSSYLDDYFSKITRSVVSYSTYEALIMDYYQAVKDRNITHYNRLTGWKYKMIQIQKSRHPSKYLDLENVNAIFGNRLKIGNFNVTEINKWNISDKSKAVNEFSVNIDIIKNINGSKDKAPSIRFIKIANDGKSVHVLSEGTSP